MVRFIHASDLHLGKRFGAFSGDLPGRLREARHAVIGRLADLARQHGAATVLLAGDTFDSETPAADILRQALNEMRQCAPLRFVILPGNHDSLQAVPLWEAMQQAAADNVTLAIACEPIALAENAVLLPAPCTTRRPGRDLTAWMESAATAEGVIRIGLAHGAIRDFSEEGGAADIIPPDRAARAGLAYLALGDWHGALAVDARTFYSGTPEPDRFKHDAPGGAFIVSIDGPAAVPSVERAETGSFLWRQPRLHLLGQEDAASAFLALLPESRRRQALIRVVASGRCPADARTALAATLAAARPDFALLELDEADLLTDYETGDLDRIDRAGALREAADSLLAEAADQNRQPAERDIARAALARLYGLALEQGGIEPSAAAG